MQDHFCVSYFSVQCATHIYIIKKLLLFLSSHLPSGVDSLYVEIFDEVCYGIELPFAQKSGDCYQVLQQLKFLL